MRSPRVSTVLTYGILSLAGIFSFSLPDSLLPTTTGFLQAPPDTIYLAGIIHDFSYAHADFDVIPAEGFGHYAGYVALTLDVNNKPVFTGGGYRVDAQWQDSSARQIAPHLYNTSVNFWTPRVVIFVADPLNLTPNDQVPIALLDSWGYIVTLLDDDATAAEINAAGAVNDLAYITIGADNNVVKDELRDIPIGVVCENTHVRKKLGWPPGSSGTTTDAVVISDNTHYITEPFSNGPLTLFTSPQPVAGTNFGSGMLGYAPGDAGSPLFQVLDVGDALHPSGTAVGRRVQLPWGDDGFDLSSINANAVTLLRRALEWAGGATLSGCNAIADTAGTAGSTSDAAVTSVATFSEWYRDTLGVNQSGVYGITLTRDINGVYEFLTNDFNPIDDMLLGNEGDAHNYFFTYAIGTEFTYEECAGQFIEFRGTDDAWIFINGSLVMDLGGVGANTVQYVEFDRMGMVDGQSYQLDFFYAQRQGALASFNLRTNILLSSDVVIPSVSAAFD